MALTTPRTVDPFCAIPQRLLRALEGSGLSRAELLVALRILYRTYQWTPARAQLIGYEEFTNQTGLHRRSVIRAVHQLEAWAVITVERRRRAPNVNEVNVYRVNPPEWWRTRHYPAAEDATTPHGANTPTPGGADVPDVVAQVPPNGTTLNSEAREAALSKDSKDDDHEFCGRHSRDFICPECRRMAAPA